MQINKKKFAMTLGTFAAVMHLIWDILVASNLAQPLSYFVHRMHFIDDMNSFIPFSLDRALGLIVLAFLVAYTIGYIFASIWNHFHKVHLPK